MVFFAVLMLCLILTARRAEAEVRFPPGVPEDMFPMPDGVSDDVCLTADEIEYVNAMNPGALYGGLGLRQLPPRFGRSFVPEADKHFVPAANDPRRAGYENAAWDAFPDEVCPRFGVAVSRSLLYRLPMDVPVGDEADRLVGSNARAEFLPLTPLAMVHGSRDGEWAYVLMEHGSGWVRREHIALCGTRDEWAGRLEPDEFVTVTSPYITLPYEPYDSRVSCLTFPMGTRIPVTDGGSTLPRRSEYGCYMARLPVRGEDGYIEDVNVPVPVTGVVKGFLPMTPRNILRTAYGCLGQRYGWAGQNLAQDCSGFVRDVYLCFGLRLPRLSKGQIETKGLNRTDLSGMTTDEKRLFVRSLPEGTLLQFPGHIMMYAGRGCVINALGSAAWTPDGKMHDVNSVTIVSLEDTYRANGKTWMEEMKACLRGSKLPLR